AAFVQIRLIVSVSYDWCDACHSVRRERRPHKKSFGAGRHTMIGIAHFAGLVVTTVFAASAAVLLDWLLLRAMFQLMRPAVASAKGPSQKTASTRTPTTAYTTGAQAKAYATAFRSELVHGTRELARQFGPAALRR